MTTTQCTKILAGLAVFIVTESRAFEIQAVNADGPELETKVFEIDGRNLYYHDKGSGRPILILHGADLHQ